MTNMELCSTCQAENLLEKIPAFYFPIQKQYSGTATYAFCEKCRKEAMDLLVNPWGKDIEFECFSAFWDSLSPTQKLLFIRYQEVKAFPMTYIVNLWATS